MDRSVQVLKLEMQGRWYATELGSAACAISDLYDLRFVLELISEDQRDWEHFFDEGYESWHYLRPNKSPSNFSGWWSWTSWCKAAEIRRRLRRLQPPLLVLWSVVVASAAS